MSLSDPTVRVLLVGLVLLAGCGDDSGGQGSRTHPEPPAPVPMTITGSAPRVEATVVKDGDAVLVMLDIARTDPAGRRVLAARLEGPAGDRAAAPPPEDEAPFVLETHVPPGTRSVKVHGESEGGGAWSVEVGAGLPGG